MSSESSSDLPESDPHVITRVLAAAAREEPKAAAELLPLVYDELRRIAQARLSHLAPGQTLQATALVHEAWIRVVAGGDPGWECRAHFFGAAARAMRNILVEQYRRRVSLKRGADHVRVEESELTTISVDTPSEDLLALDEVLERLEQRDPLKAQIVMLRFFTGLTMNEVADVLGLPLTRVEREWRFGRSWLQREIEGVSPTPEA